MSLQEQLVGNWKLIFLTQNGHTRHAERDMTMAFRADGTYALVLGCKELESQISGAYEVSGNRIKRYCKTGLELDTRTFDVHKTQMTLLFPGDTRFVFQRVDRVPP